MESTPPDRNPATSTSATLCAAALPRSVCTAAMLCAGVDTEDTLTLLCGKISISSGNTSTKQCRQWRRCRTIYRFSMAVRAHTSSTTAAKRRYGFMRGVTYCKYCPESTRYSSAKANSK